MEEEDSTVKALSTSTTLPTRYLCQGLDPSADHTSTAQIPVIDFSLLAHAEPEQRSLAVRELGNACQDWGFFIVVNHGVPERVMSAVLEKGREFFDLPEKEKRAYAGKHPLDPVRCGTSFNIAVEDVRYWRDFLKLFFVYPNLTCPDNPINLRETLLEYCAHIRRIAKVLLEGIGESLGLEEGYLVRELSIDDEGLSHLAINFYPPCPQPDLALGLPPHSDHGLITLLMQNDVCGLQVRRNGKWVPVKPFPNSLLVNTGDHMEIFSNGKYKSVIHRAVLNNEATRMSVAVVQGPAMEKVVAPAAPLVCGEAGGGLPAYRGVNYREFLRIQQGSQLREKSVLDALRIHAI